MSVPELFLVSVQLTHDKTGAQHLHIARDDSNNVFRYNITIEHSLIFNIVTGLSRKTIGWICMYVQKVTVGVTHLIPLQFAHRYPSVFYFGKNEEAVPALFNKEIVVVICMLVFFFFVFFFCLPLEHIHLEDA